MNSLLTMLSQIVPLWKTRLWSLDRELSSHALYVFGPCPFNVAVLTFAFFLHYQSRGNSYRKCQNSGLHVDLFSKLCYPPSMLRVQNHTCLLTDRFSSSKAMLYIILSVPDSTLQNRQHLTEVLSLRCNGFLCIPSCQGKVMKRFL